MIRFSNLEDGDAALRTGSFCPCRETCPESAPANITEKVQRRDRQTAFLHWSCHPFVTWIVRGSSKEKGRAVDLKSHMLRRYAPLWSNSLFAQGSDVHAQQGFCGMGFWLEFAWGLYFSGWPFPAVNTFLSHLFKITWLVDVEGRLSTVRRFAFCVDVWRWEVPSQESKCTSFGLDAKCRRNGGGKGDGMRARARASYWQ